MLSSIALVLATLAFLPLSIRYPAAGLISWIWFSLMSPQQEIYGFAAGWHFGLVIGAATLIGWILSPERKRWTPDFMPKLMSIFVAWMTFNSFFAVIPDYSWAFWRRFMSDMVLMFLVFFIAYRKARIHAIVWIMVISIGYYAAKGGIFTILTGGHHIVFGPAGSIISDNNDLALAVVMTLPLVVYLWMHSRSRGIQLGLASAIFLEITMVMGTHSRGGMIALASTLLMMFWASSRKKIFYGIAIVVPAIVAFSLMPESYVTHLGTVTDPMSDTSFIGRTQAWQVALDVALHRFPFGAGFYAPQVSSIFHEYLPGAIPHAAHSIYFQVLGEHGFIGFAIYLLIIVVALRNSRVVLRQTRSRPDLLWAHDLARMIRISLISFCIGGAALSMAYFSGFLLLIALLSALREITMQVARNNGTNLIHIQLSAHGPALPFIDYTVALRFFGETDD